MVAAETFASLNIHQIEVNMNGQKKIPCKIDGSDHYPGLGVTWSTTDFDVDVAEDDDPAFAGVLGAPDNHDLDTVFSDGDESYVIPPGAYAWVKYVQSGGTLAKGVKVGISKSTDGYFMLNGSDQLARGEFVMDSDGSFTHTTVAAVAIIMIKVESGYFTSGVAA